VLAGLAGQLADARQETISRPLYPFYNTPVLALSPTLSLPLPVSPVPMASNVAATLDIVIDSLRQGRGALLIEGPLGDLRRQLEVFGLHVARLDLRQHSAWHEKAIAEVLSLVERAVSPPTPAPDDVQRAANPLTSDLSSSGRAANPGGGTKS
jgi:hypothetical protein